MKTDNCGQCGDHASAENFNYPEAFSRNIGWVTRDEQTALRGKRVAIAGMGGVGGSYLASLSRLGVGRFSIADMDSFETANRNRQAGAFESTLDQPKVQVMATMARDINPTLDLRLFPQGVTLDNLDEFLQDADIFLDGLDFFALDIRRAVFAACAKKGIPALTAAPVGMGVSLLVFLPGQMSFEDYFKFEGLSVPEQYLRFLMGLSPQCPQGQYFVDPSTVDLANRRAPSTVIACELCAAVATAHALKILLQRGKVLAAPEGLHFDAYLCECRETRWIAPAKGSATPPLPMPAPPKQDRESARKPTTASPASAHAA